MGILIKGSNYLEQLADTEIIVFDKTGTLTYGRLRIAHFVNHSNIDDKTLLLWISSLELQSTHPIRGAFELYMKQNDLKVNEKVGVKFESFRNRRQCGR